ncbi:hypothetical protein VNO78_23504 [Psophocarpus tetragonolobus]|uniref:Uncharacterized protein n=1 Tax=Psophocarpus tetragonolobus TaxID=3891 RepID=A0AAN9XDU9_PSOTE
MGGHSSLFFGFCLICQNPYLLACLYYVQEQGCLNSFGVILFSSANRYVLYLGWQFFISRQLARIEISNASIQSRLCV